MGEGTSPAKFPVLPEVIRNSRFWVFSPLSDSAQVVPHHCDLFALLVYWALDFFFFFFPKRILVGLCLCAPAASEHPSRRGPGVCLPPASTPCSGAARDSPEATASMG